MGLIRTLPGFLGLQSDWDFLPWSHSGDEGDLLLGYSMGGRLALRLLEQRSFSRAAIISAGLNVADADRRLRDEAWARRFESEEWEPLMRAWNAQEVLSGHVVERREADFDRAELARQLREYSPAVLPAPQLQSIETPVLWIAGAHDAKYVEIGRRAVALLPNAELWICPGAGHRVLWEQPEALVERLRSFFDLH